MKSLESNKHYYIAQELCEYDLRREIKSGNKMPEKQAIAYLTQICNGMLAIVKKGIIHRDLKPANILVKKGVLKFVDFGFAKKNMNYKENYSIVGTPLYMSLQLLKGQPYTSKCDIWSIGVIFYELLHGTTPWSANTQFELINNIKNMPLSIKSKFKPETKDFLRKLLKVKEEDRVTWKELFMHPIFEGYFDYYAAELEEL